MAAKVDEHVFLKGRPPMTEFLGVVKGQMEMGPGVIAKLSDEWRQAHALIVQLQQQEAGIADNLPAQKLSAALQALAERVEQNAIYQESFNVVKPVIGMVELDKLVVFQKHINLSFVESIKVALGDKPSEEDIFHACLPFFEENKAPKPEIVSARVDGGAFVFMSPSADIRVLDTRLLKPEQISAYQVGGPVSEVLSIAVGSGSNCLSAMRVNNRLILNNGSHRAYALRALGITHVPCVVQNLTKNEELPLVATKDFLANPSEYIGLARPPLLKDYFNKELIKILPVTRKIRQIKISYKVEVIDVPAV